MPFKGVLISVSNPLLFKNRKSLCAGRKHQKVQVRMAKQKTQAPRWLLRPPHMARASVPGRPWSGDEPQSVEMLSQDHK